MESCRAGQAGFCRKDDNEKTLQIEEEQNHVISEEGKRQKANYMRNRDESVSEIAV
jgi:hypothetical protein